MDKNELLREMRGAYAPIAAAVAALSDRALLTEAPGMEPWTRKDVVAHIEFWHRYGAVLVRGARSGVDPGPDGAGGDLDAINARAYEADRDRTADDVRRGLIDSFADLASAVEAATERELFDASVQPWSSGSAADEVLSDTSAHYAKHAPHLGLALRDRAGALGAMRNTHASVASAAAALSDEALLAEAPGMPGWTRKDVLAHVEWWHRHSAAVLRGLRSGVDPYPDGDEPWDIDTHNARVLAENRIRSAADVRTGETASFDDLVAAVEAATDHELFDEGVQPWLAGTAIAMVAADTWDHYPEHEPHLAAD
jgi:hypothetical protein